jgi:hypothetical protein
MKQWTEQQPPPTAWTSNLWGLSPPFKQMTWNLKILARTPILTPIRLTGGIEECFFWDGGLRHIHNTKAQKLAKYLYLKQAHFA